MHTSLAYNLVVNCMRVREEHTCSNSQIYFNSSPSEHRNAAKRNIFILVVILECGNKNEN